MPSHQDGTASEKRIYFSLSAPFSIISYLCLKERQGFGRGGFFVAGVLPGGGGRYWRVTT
jgi:hypothetical protein